MVTIFEVMPIKRVKKGLLDRWAFTVDVVCPNCGERCTVATYDAKFHEKSMFF